MKPQTIFLTGATGKIGSPLLKKIIAEDYNIILLMQEGEKTGIGGPNIKYIYGDIRKPSSYASNLEGVDAVVHMAAVTHTNDINKYYELNAVATLNLIKICKEYNVKRFIFISTRAISEDGGHYSRSKSIAERYVKESGLDWVIVRLAEVYGIKGKTGVDMVLNDVGTMPFIPIIGNGEYKIAPVHILDVVMSIRRVIIDDRIKYKIYNIAGPESLTFNRFLDIVLAIKNIKKSRIHIPISLIRILSPIMALFLKDRILVNDQVQRLLCEKSDDISLAVKELDFSPTPLDEYLQSKS